jgi:hypothetical protein
MTDGPTFSVRHDPRWHELPMDGDPQAWGDQAARAAWTVSGREPSAAQLQSFGAGLASLCDYVRTVEPALAFVFTPEPWAGPTTLVLVTAAPLPSGNDGASRVAVLALLAVPDDRLAEPQDVDELDTAAGPALRVRQRRVQTDDTGRRAVTEHLLYAWPDPGQGMVLVASTSFPDLVEAGRWAGAVDDLARGMSFGDG